MIWMETGKEMPPEGVRVLVSDPGMARYFNPCVGFYRYITGHGAVWSFEHNPLLHRVQPMYWAELPRPGDFVSVESPFLCPSPPTST